VRTSTRAFILSVVIVLATSRDSVAAAPAGGEEILAILASHASLQSYTANLKADFRERSFPFMRLSLNGDAFYRAPDRYAVVFHDAPAYMKGFAQGYSMMMDIGAWPREFSAQTLPDRTTNGRLQHVIRLTANDPKTPLHHGDISIDAATADIMEMDWQFVNGMIFTIAQEFEQMPTGEHAVAAQHATFHVPFASGTATVHLTNYRYNVAISDEVFTLDR
jgi:hypothetical protein